MPDSVKKSALLWHSLTIISVYERLKVDISQTSVGRLWVPWVSPRHKHKIHREETSGTAVFWAVAAARNSSMCTSQPMTDNYALTTDIICTRLHVLALTLLFLSHHVLSHKATSGRVLVITCQWNYLCLVVRTNVSVSSWIHKKRYKINTWDRMHDAVVS